MRDRLDRSHLRITDDVEECATYVE